MIIIACENKVNWGCPFENAEFPHCQIASKDKKCWCYYKDEEIGFALPPDWCPLRRENIVVRLGGQKNE